MKKTKLKNALSKFTKSIITPKVKQTRENISINYIHNYAAETNFENLLMVKVLGLTHSIIHFSRRFSGSALVCRTSQDFPGPFAIVCSHTIVIAILQLCSENA